MLIEKILTLAIAGVITVAVLSSVIRSTEPADIKTTLQKREYIFEALNVYFSTHCTKSPIIFDSPDLTGAMVSDGVIELKDTTDEIGVFTSRIEIGKPSFLYVTLKLHEAPTPFITNRLAPLTVSDRVLVWKKSPDQGDTHLGRTEEIILFKNIHELRCF